MFHSIAKTARKLHVSPQTLKKKALEGKIGYTEVLGKMKFSDEHINKVLKENGRPTANESVIC